MATAKNKKTETPVVEPKTVPVDMTPIEAPVGTPEATEVFETTEGFVVYRF